MAVAQDAVVVQGAVIEGDGNTAGGQVVVGSVVATPLTSIVPAVYATVGSAVPAVSRALSRGLSTRSISSSALPYPSTDPNESAVTCGHCKGKKTQDDGFAAFFFDTYDDKDNTVKTDECSGMFVFLCMLPCIIPTCCCCCHNYPGQKVDCLTCRGSGLMLRDAEGKLKPTKAAATGPVTCGHCKGKKELDSYVMQSFHGSFAEEANKTNLEEMGPCFSFFMDLLVAPCCVFTCCLCGDAMPGKKAQCQTCKGSGLVLLTDTCKYVAHDPANPDLTHMYRGPGASTRGGTSGGRGGGLSDGGAELAGVAGVTAAVGLASLLFD